MSGVKVKVQVFVNGVKVHPKPKLKLLWTVGPVSEQFLPGPFPGVTNMIQLTDTQQVDVSIVATDKKGQVAQVQGVTFQSSDANVVTVNQDTVDPSKAVVVAGLPGTAQVIVNADADLGEGVTPLTGTLDVTVVAGSAVSLGVNTGTPTEQP